MHTPVVIHVCPKTKLENSTRAALMLHERMPHICVEYRGDPIDFLGEIVTHNRETGLPWSVEFVCYSLDWLLHGKIAGEDLWSGEGYKLV